jgi:hypothetical protein
MAKRSGRVQKEKRPSSLKVKPGFLVHPLQFLVNALNGDLPAGFRGNRRVMDTRALLLLVKRFQALDDVLRDKMIPLVARDRQGEIIDSPVVMSSFRSVNRLLRRYVAVPYIEPRYFVDPSSSSRGWSLRWGPAVGHAHKHSERAFALQILDIADRGRISYLKQCANTNCRKWLFARFSHQRFCEDSCKEEYHRSDPIDKQRRRDWAKKNYRLQTRKNVK